MARPSLAPFFPGTHRGLHVALSILTLGLWLVALLTLWLFRTGRRRAAAIVGGVTGVLVIAIVAGLVSGGSTATEQGTSGAAAAQPPASAPGPDETTSACTDFGANVQGYSTLEPGASREEYLTLLHKLQRDCPAEADRLGLTGEGLPQCRNLAQENCTMYEGP